jgi:hypothetical protein
MAKKRTGSVIRKLKIEWLNPSNVELLGQTVKLQLQNSNWKARSGNGLRTEIFTSIELFHLTRINNSVRLALEKQIEDAQQRLAHFEQSTHHKDPLH